jgi:hypothetical protein
MLNQICCPFAVQTTRLKHARWIKVSFDAKQIIVNRRTSDIRKYGEGEHVAVGSHH